MPPTSAIAWRTRSRAAGLLRTVSFMPRSGRTAILRGVGDRAVEPGQRARAGDGAHQVAAGRVLRRAVQPRRHDDEPPGVQMAVRDGAQEHLGAGAVPCDERPGPGGVDAERAMTSANQSSV